MIHGDYQTAFINFGHVMKSNPDNPFAFYYAGECAKKMGDSETAERLIGQAFEIKNKDKKWDELFEKYNIKINESKKEPWID